MLAYGIRLLLKDCITKEDTQNAGKLLRRYYELERDLFGE